jgi:hypothetical protein
MSGVSHLVIDECHRAAAASFVSPPGPARRMMSSTFCWFRSISLSATR